MPRIIKDGAIIDNRWLPVDIDAPAADDQIHSLDQWRNNPGAAAVQLEPGEEPWPLLESLDTLELVAINFPVFTDGRGFSYARELRERGYGGEIRAVGHFQRDQMFYLKRCGFNAFDFAEDVDLEDALSSLEDFHETYQAAPDQHLPLFRRRA